jgi:hypothetical protein
MCHVLPAIAKQYLGHLEIQPRHFDGYSVDQITTEAIHYIGRITFSEDSIELFAPSWDRARSLARDINSLRRLGLFADALVLANPSWKEGNSHARVIFDPHTFASVLHALLVMTSCHDSIHGCPEYAKENVIETLADQFIAYCTGEQASTGSASSDREGQDRPPKFHLFCWLIRKQRYDLPDDLLWRLSRVILWGAALDKKN